MRRALTLSLLSLTLVCGLNGCAVTRTRTSLYAPVAGPERGRIFCADGAGSTPATAASNAFQVAVAEAGLLLRVEVVPWSYGRGRVVADQTDYARVRLHGRRLAESVTAYRRANPESEVYLLGHSAGTGVVLAALESLLPATVDRAFLLAPAVSYDYDLRQALRATRRGIDVYYSSRDRFVLGLVTGSLGTTDRRRTAAAGRIGFQPILTSPEDQALYANLRQHPWGPDVAWTGSRGGHFDSYRLEYVRAYIVPLLKNE